jgi:hypothetical protein
MNKNAIKKFATEARQELISRVSQKAINYGIDEKNIGNPNAQSVNGYLLSPVEMKQRAALINQIQEKGFKQVMEEVAYTWFNRFSALRFMEVNGYLPSRVRIFTDENNAFKPQILVEAIYLDMEGLNKEKVYAYKEANDDEALFKYLLITQCNALNKVLPGMFQKIEDYTELLFPDYLLREGSVIHQMIELIPEDDWKDSVQIIGWLYQYYNSEKKDIVFAKLKKNIKITKENIPAATQLFTPDWIVRYMVENSLGRLWLEGHPNFELQSKWKYYLEEAEQEPEVQAQLEAIRADFQTMKPEEISCIDPCSGSGHILVYMFDVLMQIYESYGVDTRTAVKSIVENNLYGLDIDDRAAQLTYFSVMMKACQYDRRFLNRGIQPQVYSIVESNNVDSYAMEYFCNGDSGLEEAMKTIVEELHDAKEYGSLITVSTQNWAQLYNRFAKIENETVQSIYTESVLELKTLVNVAEVLSREYHVVVTNPPYMGSRGMNSKLSSFINRYYSAYKRDFFSCFVVRCSEMTSQYGFSGFLTPYVWMFIQRYEKLRLYLYENMTIETLIQFEYSAFEEATVPICTFVLKKVHTAKKGCYLRLEQFRGGMEVQRQKTLEAVNNRDCDYFYEQTTEKFSNVPGNPVAYWLSENMLKIFANSIKLGQIADVRQGLATTDNKRFLRLWFEIEYSKIGFSIKNTEEAQISQYKWFPYNKGGDFRRWYGNNDYVVNYENDGKEIKENVLRKYKYLSNPDFVVKNTEFYFKPSVSWSLVSSGAAAFRYKDQGFIFDVAGMSFFSDVYMNYLLGLVNTKVVFEILKILAPTINFQCGDIANIPVIIDEEKKPMVEKIALENVALSRTDWNWFENSWEFCYHPLLRKSTSFLRGAYADWEEECNERFQKLKKNEEILNEIFINMYGLNNELSSEVDNAEISVCKANYTRDIKSFISYAVGCMFGRYSLDEEGLIYAGGDWDSSRYKTFEADRNNIIPICDEEYFQDDIVERFVDFVEVVYGEETLQENLQFIAEALGGKGLAKEVIRNYFINDFYKDHCKMYQKRPIYWLFDSGKKNGFKCLIYMHRYRQDTIARIRTDYVHEQQARYRTAIDDLTNQLDSASGNERVKLNKKLSKLIDQATELQEYEEKIHHLADQMIAIDLDDGVKYNYEIFSDVLAKIR